MEQSGSKVILVAEDDPQVRRMLVRMLETAGYTVLVAQDGQAAWEILEKHPTGIDLLVSNVVMPRMTGVELAERVSTARPEIRILLISAFDQGLVPPERHWPLVTKPFTSHGILQRIAELLGG